MRARRLFLALWPDEKLRSRLKDRLETGLRIRDGRPEPVANLHVTLVFIGDVEAGCSAAIERAVAGVPGPAFTLSLERVGYWPRPRILWLGPREAPPALCALVGTLRAAVVAGGGPVETRPYLPHMTLARKVLQPPREDHIEPLTWEVTAYSLLESVPDASRRTYLEVGSWPLRQVTG
ncbi:MAG: RNA 2',3'-cyclic phosphodiesterase [Gammaproteobacteria bacterium]|nr:RNA 2',3'-cyclic phosphodiesterase [Gammaproteobacteria bacterium]